jgi:DNA-binding NarL/FixJ family response regulator
VLVIASAQSRGELIACIEAGAHGCILEETSIDDLKSAIETVLKGELYCTRKTTDLIFAQLAASAEEARVRRRIDPATLTHRELEVLGMVADGFSNKQIAQELHLSLYTVKNHVHNILDKLPANSRHEAAHLARQQQWLPT